MNHIGRTIYDLVKHNPGLKFAIRNAYQRVFDLLPAPKPQSAYPIKVREGFFFGFHDHTPFSPDSEKLLANRYHIPLHMPLPGETLQVGYFYGKDHERFIPVSETRAWNWHMGCKLQWRGSTGQLVFNDHLDGANIARMIHVESGKEIVLSDSIGSVSPDGHWAVGYSFARVDACMPGYGYGYGYDIGDQEIDDPAPKHNGIHLIDLDSGERRLLFSLADLADMRPEPSMKGRRHFVTHTVISPDSRRFIFLHRWTGDDTQKRWSRLISCDINGKNMVVFPAVDMVSHIGWRNAHEVIAYCRLPDHGDHYVLFRDKQPNHFEVIGKGQLTSDGHPSFDPSGRWMVTDTYPDRRRVQRLVLYDYHGKRSYDICRLHMPRKFQSPSAHQHWSCDLHPRFDPSGRYICFDATYTGTRSLCTIDLGAALEDGTLKSLNEMP